jgi:phosphoglycolate phosphatase
MAHLSIIFDLDGTLLDTLEDLSQTVNEVLVFKGMPTHEALSYKGFIGDGLRQLMERSAPPDAGETTIDELCALFQERYLLNWRKNCRPYPGINELLRELTMRKISCAVLSNKPHEFTKLFVREFFPHDYFKAVYGQQPEFAKKPHPQMALRIAQELGCQPAEMLFVGDSGVDMRTGKAAGMQSVGVLWGFRERGELLTAGADYLLNTPEELLLYV